MTKMNMFVHIVHHVSMETGDDGYWPFMEPRKTRSQGISMHFVHVARGQSPSGAIEVSAIPTMTVLQIPWSWVWWGHLGGGVQKWIDSGAIGVKMWMTPKNNFEHGVISKSFSGPFVWACYIILYQRVSHFLGLKRMRQDFPRNHAMFGSNCYTLRAGQSHTITMLKR